MRKQALGSLKKDDHPSVRIKVSEGLTMLSIIPDAHADVEPESLTPIELQVIAQRAGLMALRASVDCIEELQEVGDKGQQGLVALRRTVEDLSYVSEGQGLPYHYYSSGTLIRLAVAEAVWGKTNHTIQALELADGHSMKVPKPTLRKRFNLMPNAFRSLRNDGMTGRVKKLITYRVSENTEQLHIDAIELLKSVE